MHTHANYTLDLQRDLKLESHVLHMHEVNSYESPYIYSLHNIILYALHVHAPQNYSHIYLKLSATHQTIIQLVLLMSNSSGTNLKQQN